MNLLALFLPVLVLLQPSEAPKITAELYAAQTSLQPGGQTELAIKINIPEDWHTYHPIILDTGAPTTISFFVPEGVSIGELQFPTPYFGEQAGLRYLELDDTFVVLTTVTAAPDLKPGTITIKANVDALVCKELCAPAEAAATLSLGVSPAESAPANEQLFKDARDALPKPLADAGYLAGGTVEVSKEQIGVNEEAELVLTVRVKKGHHVWDRDPGADTLTGSQLFVEKINGIRLGEQNWPKPHVKVNKMLGSLREQRGDIKIRIPVALIDDKFPSGPVAVRFVFTYQACTDAGTCFMPEAATGVFRFVADTPNEPLSVGASLSNFAPLVTVVAAPVSPFSLATLLWNLVVGFLGGLILNVMPCVFPVISIKILSFVKQAGEQRGRILRLGLTFCAGIMVWFWAFGILTSLGQIPWQHPPVVIGLTALLFVFALNLLGVFEIVLPGAAAGKLNDAATREGYPGAFMKGLLATLLGTACTAPFFAGAAAYAALQPPLISFLIFTAAGLGMCSPYVVLSAFPGWLKHLPKPGQWMVTFKQVMGFVLIGTAIWLLLVLADQIGGRGVVWTIAFLSFLSVSVWLLGRIQLTWTGASRAITWLSAIAIALFGVWFCFFRMFNIAAPTQPGGLITTDGRTVAAIADDVEQAMATASWDEHVPWQPFQPGLPEELSRRGYTVFVDFTATWCVTCQTNKGTSIDIESTRRAMKELGVVPVEADFTQKSAAIRDILLSFGHNSVPLYLIYPAGVPDAVIKLPVLLTPGIVTNGLDRAGPSSPAQAVEVAGTPTGPAPGP